VECGLQIMMMPSMIVLLAWLQNSLATTTFSLYDFTSLLQLTCTLTIVLQVVLQDFVDYVPRTIRSITLFSFSLSLSHSHCKPCNIEYLPCGGLFVTSSHEIHSEKEQEIHRWNLLTFEVRDTETVFVWITWLPQFFAFGATTLGDGIYPCPGCIEGRVLSVSSQLRFMVCPCSVSWLVLLSSLWLSWSEPWCKCFCIVTQMLY
jgi:hypothetical protein